MPKTEWKVWLADGTTRNSREHRWADDWDGVLVVRWWGARKGINWGDGLYGRPDTFKSAGLVSDEEFNRVLELARGDSHPPSKR